MTNQKKSSIVGGLVMCFTASVAELPFWWKVLVSSAVFAATYIVTAFILHMIARHGSR